MWISVLRRPDCPDYAIHQYLWSYFPELQREGARRQFIFRVLDNSILMLSRIKPLCDSVNIVERIKQNQIYQFDVLASPQCSSSYRDESGKRVTNKRRSIEGNSARREWLQRRVLGAEIKFSQVFDQPVKRFKKPGGHQVVVTEALFRGTLYVLNVEEFVDSILNGIGGRGAWGCGLLVLPEIMADGLRS